MTSISALGTVRRYARLYRAFVRNCLMREMEFNFNFLSLVIADLFGLGTTMLFFSIIYSKVETLAGWTRWETLFFLGTFYLVDAVNMMVFMHNVFRLPWYVRTGDLDLVLVKPVDAQFYVMTRYFHLGHVSQLIGSLILIAYSWMHLGVSLSLPRIILFVLLCFNGFLILGVSFFVMAEPSLWMVRSEGFMALDALFQFALRPDGIYGRVLRFIFTALVPMTVIASFPARLMFGKITWLEVAWSFAATAIIIAASRMLWRYGLRRYESASS